MYTFNVTTQNVPSGKSLITFITNIPVYSMITFNMTIKSLLPPIAFVTLVAIKHLLIVFALNATLKVFLFFFKLTAGHIQSSSGVINKNHQ